MEQTPLLSNRSNISLRSENGEVGIGEDEEGDEKGLKFAFWASARWSDETRTWRTWTGLLVLVTEDVKTEEAIGFT